MRSFFTSFALLLALTGCSGTERDSGSESPPLNIVLFIVDDLGWRDAGVLGSDFYDTPAIDALAASGVRFSRFYSASPVCTPTRTSILTGRHPARSHITNWTLWNDRDAQETDGEKSLLGTQHALERA